MKIAVLDQHHPRYNADDLARWEALYEGGARWRRMIERFLPKNPEETAPVYECRKALATYVNHAGPILDLVFGWLFADAPTLDGGDPSPVPEGWESDVDRARTGWAHWWRQLAVRAGVGRRAYVWVNLPAPADAAPATLAEQEAQGGTRAYLVGLDADEVINWTLDEAGALASVMIRRETTEQADLLSPQGRVYRWTYIDGTVIRRWEWRPVKNGPQAPADTDEASELPMVDHGFGAIPVVAIDYAPGLHVMGKLEDPAIALTADTNDLRWGLHRNMHPLLVEKTGDTSHAPPTLGAGWAYRVGEKDDVAYVESSGAGFAAMEARIKGDREDLYRVVQQMAQSASADSTKASTSGASKAMDWQSLEIMLGAYAAVIRTAMAQTLALLSVVWRCDPDAVTTTGLGSWSDEDMAEKLTNLQLAMSDVKSETFRREVGKRLAGALLDDASPDLLAIINAEIEAADYSDALVVLPPSPAVSAPGTA